MRFRPSTILVQSLVVSGTRRRPLRPNSPPPDPGAPSVGAEQGQQLMRAGSQDMQLSPGSAAIDRSIR